MLVVKRHTDESIVIGGGIRVTVTMVGRGFVRLGIEAPRDVPVHREEIWEKIREESPDGVVRSGVRGGTDRADVVPPFVVGEAVCGGDDDA